MVLSSGEVRIIGSGMQSQSNTTIPVKVSSKKEEETDSNVKIPASKIKYHKIGKHDKYKISGSVPENYISAIKVPKTNVDNLMKLNNKFKLVTFKVPDESHDYYVRSCYMIDYINSPIKRKGEGTKAVRSVLEKSLTDRDTEGRLITNITIIDGETSAAGFFYKLGFRFLESAKNDIMKEWVNDKNSYLAPKLTGIMYLPKENVNRLMVHRMLL